MCRIGWKGLGRIAVVLAGLQAGGAPGMEPSPGSRQAGPPVAAATPGEPRMHLDRLNRLPDLTVAARASGTTDMYAELERLKRAHDAAKTPHRYSMPYRNPPRPCKSGAHSVPAVRHTLVNPARGESVELWEADLHEAEVHGARLPEMVVMFLEHLSEK